MAMCKNCGARVDTDELSGGECLGCRGVRTLPREEFEEMSSKERQAARRMGIKPEPQVWNEIDESLHGNH